MNCKPGDLAIIVRDGFGERMGIRTCFANFIGFTVQVDRVVAEGDPIGPVWQLKGRPLDCPGCGDKFSVAYDCELQPIRPPSLDKSAPVDVSMPAGVES